MKTVVINRAGHTGKTIIAKHMIAPLTKSKRASIHCEGARDHNPDLKVTAKKFHEFAAILFVSEEGFVIDVGASQAGAIIDQFNIFESIKNMIDLWIVPCSTSDQKQSIITISDLLDIGIEEEKIMLVTVRRSNDRTEDVAQFIQKTKGLFAGVGCRIKVNEVAILENPVYLELENDPRSAIEIAKRYLDLGTTSQRLRALTSNDSIFNLDNAMNIYNLSCQAQNNINAVFGEFIH